jgi:hypothetical protein
MKPRSLIEVDFKQLKESATFWLKRYRTTGHFTYLLYACDATRAALRTSRLLRGAA